MILNKKEQFAKNRKTHVIDCGTENGENLQIKIIDPTLGQINKLDKGSDDISDLAAVVAEIIVDENNEPIFKNAGEVMESISAEQFAMISESLGEFMDSGQAVKN